MGIPPARERFVPPLIHVSVAHALLVFLPPPHVRDRQALHESPELPVLARPDDQGPVVGHQAVRQQTRGEALLRLRQDVLEGGVVGVIVEEG